MNQNDIHELVEKQRAYFYSNKTLNIDKRIHALKQLQACILKYEKEIAESAGSRSRKKQLRKLYV